MMEFVTLLDLKRHLNMTEDETDFDTELSVHFSAAKEKVKAYINRPLVTTMPIEPQPHAMVINDSVNRAVLEVAGYYFDSKGAAEPMIVNGMLETYVGHCKMIRI